MTGHWVATWVAMPQPAEPDNLPPAPFTSHASSLADCTLRQTVRVSVGGEHVRLRISNVFGTTPLAVGAASVALPLGGRAGVAATRAGTDHPIMFDGRASVRIPAGAQFVSDPLAFPLAPRSNLTVSLYVAGGLPPAAVTSHPGSRTTSYLVAGDHVDDGDLQDAVPVEHWYLLGGLEVWAEPATATVVVLGDSLTDGRGSTTNGNDRWPDQLADRLHDHAATTSVAVANQAAGGNRVLADGLGPNAMSRLDRDIFACPGAAWLFVFEGVNDIGTAEATPAAQKQVVDDLIGAYRQIIRQAHGHRLRVYGATITPLGGHDYDDPDGLRETTRQSVNAWIRGASGFDAIVDFDAVIRDPADKRRGRAEFDAGDGLHLNPAAYRALAEAVPLSLFERAPLPPGFGFA
jgi:lysophospholipase L1-like esterase